MYPGAQTNGTGEIRMGGRNERVGVSSTESAIFGKAEFEIQWGRDKILGQFHLFSPTFGPKVGPLP